MAVSGAKISLEFDKRELKALVKALDVYLKTIERARAKEEVGGEIYEARSRQMQDVALLQGVIAQRSLV